MNSTCEELSSWHKISSTELKQEPIGMNDENIKKWDNGLRQYQEQQQEKDLSPQNAVELDSMVENQRDEQQQTREEEGREEAEEQGVNR